MKVPEFNYVELSRSTLQHIKSRDAVKSVNRPSVYLIELAILLKHVMSRISVCTLKYFVMFSHKISDMVNHVKVEVVLS